MLNKTSTSSKAEVITEEVWHICLQIDANHFDRKYLINFADQMGKEISDVWMPQNRGCYKYLLDLHSSAWWLSLHHFSSQQLYRILLFSGGYISFLSTSHLLYPMGLSFHPEISYREELKLNSPVLIQVVQNHCSWALQNSMRVTPVMNMAPCTG